MAVETAVKEYQDELNQLSREVKDWQERYAGDAVSPRDETNTMQAKAARMEELIQSIEDHSQQKSIAAKIKSAMEYTSKGTGHVALALGDNPQAAPGESKDGWYGITDRKSGRFIPIWHEDLVAVRPDIKASMDPAYARVYDRYLRGQEKLFSFEDRTILQKGSVELKALSEGTNTAGGYLVPVDFVPRMIERMPGQAEFSQYCEHITTNRDNVVAPRVAANTGTYSTMYPNAIQGTWVSEVPAETTGETAPVFEQVSITVNTAKLFTRLSRNFLADSAVDVAGKLTSWFATASLLMRDNAFLAGTGLAQPRGVTLDATNVTSGAVAGVTTDDAKEMVYTMPKQYWTGARWFLSRDLLRTWREKKDGNGNYIFSPGFNHGMDGGIPDTIEGFPFAATDFLASASTTGNIPAVFGNPSFYWAVDRLEMSIQVLDQLYAPENQVGFLAFFRSGGMLTVSQAFNKLTIQ